MRKALAASLFVLLTACGCGGGGSGSTGPVAVAVAPVLVVAYGDSTMLGLGDSPAAGLKANTVFQNDGVSGTNIGMLLAGADFKHQPFADEMAKSKASVIVINHAINSAIISENISVATYTTQMQTAVQLALAAGKKVILDTPNPVIPGGSASVIVDIPKLDAMAQVMRGMSGVPGVTICDEAAAINAAGLAVLANYIDGVHPLQPLYDFKAAKLTACINAVL